MNVLLIDIDSRIPNLALKKVELYHRRRGDKVQWNVPILREWADKIYVSCVFEENRDKCLEWEGAAVIGGTGYDLSIKLPEEIERVKPRINMGFTTRGCIRSCGFCIVPRKEGKIRIVGDLADLWDGQSKDLLLIDNNILAVPDHFRIICKQARELNLRIDFNQGLDHRLLSPDIVRDLKGIRHKEYRLAYDSPDQHETVARAIRMLQSGSINRCMWYVLVGYDTNFREDLDRLEYLKSMKQTAFVQRFSKTRGNLLLGQWANQHGLYKQMSFQEFMSLPRYNSFYWKYVEEIKAYFGDWSAVIKKPLRYDRMVAY